MDGLVHGQCADGGGERGAVEDPEVLLRREGDRFDVVRRQRLTRRHDPSPNRRPLEDAYGGVADEQAGDVRQWREVWAARMMNGTSVHRKKPVPLTSRRGDASTERNERNNILTEEGTHSLDQLPADARVSADEGVHANEYGPTYPGLGHARRSEWV